MVVFCFVLFPHTFQTGYNFCTNPILVISLQRMSRGHIGDNPVLTEEEALQTTRAGEVLSRVEAECIRSS